MRFLSLFSGIGGFDLGLEHAGMQCVGQVEKEPYCLKVLKKHWPNVKRIEDIHDVRGYEFGTVELICGGVPCQPASTAGKRQGTSDDRWLWPETFRVVRLYKPTWCLFENVRGITSLEEGVVFDNLLTELEDCGYEVQPFIIPACGVDAQHRRDRVWIVAHADCRGLSGPEICCQQQGGTETISTGEGMADEGTEDVADSTGERRSTQRKWIQKPAEPAGGSENVADTIIKHDDRSRHGASQIRRERSKETYISTGKNVSNPSIQRRREGNTNSRRSSERTGASEEWTRLTDTLRWLPESGMGGTLDGFSSWLDGFDLTVSHESYLAYANETKKRPSEILRALWYAILPKKVQREIREPEHFSSQEILLTYLRKLETQASDKAWLQLEGKEALEEALRSLREHIQPTSPPYRPKHKKQSPEKHTDPLYALAHVLAHHSKTAFFEYRRAYANSLPPWFPGWESGIDRTSTNIPHRVDRLKALGNAVVPKIVEIIGKTIIEADKT